MKLPMSITIDFVPIDEGNWYQIEFKADYKCTDEELLRYLEYAIEGVRATIREG